MRSKQTGSGLDLEVLPHKQPRTESPNRNKTDPKKKGRKGIERKKISGNMVSRKLILENC